MRWRVRQDSNLQQPDLESGALPIGATDPIPLHLDLAMQSMRAARSAKLFKGKLFGSLFSVFCRCVILAFTLIASKSYEFPHNRNLSQQALLKNFGNDPGANGSSAFARYRQTADRGPEAGIFFEVAQKTEDFAGRTPGDCASPGSHRRSTICPVGRNGGRRVRPP